MGCAEGFFRFPSCQDCQCNENGSTSVNCDEAGRCDCKTNIGGDKCANCTDGFLEFPSCQEMRYVQITGRSEGNNYFLGGGGNVDKLEVIYPDFQTKVCQ